MARCYDGLRRTLVASLLALIAFAAPAAAQFMYLDADGDGVPTSADVVTPGGPVVFDVWLATDHDADGTAKTCALDGTTPLSIRGYYFVLKVKNGELTVSGVTNQIASFTQSWADRHTSTEILLWRSGETPLPPGTYRLATITAQITKGTPSVSIVPASESNDPASITHFESDCPGLSLDGTLLLGGDWFDTAGLAYGGEENRPPAIDPIANMSVAEGDSATQTVHASDPEGQVITLTKIRGPAYMTFTSTPSAGQATGELVLRPGFTDAGIDSGAIRATDGILTVDRSFGITVTNTNRPPTLDPIADVQAEVGFTTEVSVSASDPDGHVILTYQGPEFSEFDGWSTIRISPTILNPLGTYVGRVTASDGITAVERTFLITVVNTLHPPVVDPIEDMVAVVGDSVTQTVHAYDPDGDLLTFTPIGFPPCMRLEALPSQPPDGSARIVLQPRPGDAGQATVSVRVQDGTFQVDETFAVTVLDGRPGSTLLELSHAPEFPEIPWDTIRFDGREGTFRAASQPQGGVGVIFEPIQDNSGEQIQLACMPAQRAACVSDAIHLWFLRFLPPLGKALTPGVYTDARSAPDSAHAGLEVYTMCGQLARCPSIGQFEVKQIALGPEGQVVSFWAMFQRRCDDGGPAQVWGQVRYGAVPPVYVEVPSRVQAHAGDPLAIAMKVAGSSAGPFSLTSPDLPAGAALSLAGGTATLSWTPALEQAGLYEIHLVASAPDAPPDTTRILVCADIPGAVTATMDVNRTRVITTNRGDAAYDPSSHLGVFHPGDSDIPIAQYIELTVAGEVDGQVRIAADYTITPDYAPGPMRDGAAAPFELGFKNYLIRAGEPYGYDWNHWPVDQGAPVDESGLPLVSGDATIWSVYNDAASTASPPRLTPPLGIEVRQTTWAWRTWSPLGDVVYQRYQLRNGGSSTLENAYAAWLVEPTTLDFNGGHVGIPSRDAYGCDTTLAMGFAYSSEYWGRPNAIGVVVLDGPASGAPQLTSAQERSGIAPSLVQGLYNQMQGLRADGAPRHEYDDPSRPVTRYSFTGDPIEGVGWLWPSQWSNFSTPYIVSTGPFRLEPGEEREATIAIVGATGGDRLQAIRLLRDAAATARASFHPAENHSPIIAAPDSVEGQAGTALAVEVHATDPDGDAVTLSAEGLPSGATFHSVAPGVGRLEWTPGDGQVGSYVTSLIADDGHGGHTARALTIRVTLPPAAAASAWPLPGDEVIRLRSGRPLVWLAVEPGTDAFAATDIVPSGVTLSLAEGGPPAIGAAPGQTRSGIDQDRDGTPELGVAFTKDDLRALFSGLPAGRTVTSVKVEGALASGGRFRASATLTVESFGPKLAARLGAASKDRPATLTLQTTRPGRVRVTLFDVRGRAVRTLLERELPAGYVDIPIVGDAPGGRLPSGIYFYQVKSAEGSIGGRVLILR